MGRPEESQGSSRPEPPARQPWSGHQEEAAGAPGSEDLDTERDIEAVGGVQDGVESSVKEGEESEEQNVTEDDERALLIALQDGELGDEAALHRRRLADQQLVQAMHKESFDGELTRRTREELIDFAVGALIKWSTNGEIARQCQRQMRPIELGRCSRWWSRDHQRELAEEVAVRAWAVFERDALRQSGWDATRSCLQTYFLGLCVLQYSNVFKPWLRREEPWHTTTDPLPPPDHYEHAAAGRGGRRADPTAELVLSRQEVLRLLALTDDDQVRRALELYAEYCATMKEAAACVELTPKALEGRLRRLRRRLNGDDDQGRRPT